MPAWRAWARRERGREREQSEQCGARGRAGAAERPSNAPLRPCWAWRPWTRSSSPLPSPCPSAAWSSARARLRARARGRAGEAVSEQRTQACARAHERARGAPWASTPTLAWSSWACPSPRSWASPSWRTSSPASCSSLGLVVGLCAGGRGKACGSEKIASQVEAFRARPAARPRAAARAAAHAMGRLLTGLVGLGLCCFNFRDRASHRMQPRKTHFGTTI